LNEFQKSQPRDGSVFHAQNNEELERVIAETDVALEHLEAFAAFNGADFYGLPRNQGTLTLRREPWTPPESYTFGQAELKPLRSGESLPWRQVL
jgi:dihydroorotase